MPTYPLIHKESGEKKELSMTMKEYEQWCKDNPKWLRDYSDPSTMPGVGEVGEWKDKLLNKNPGWGEVLKKAEKSGGINARLAKRNIGTTQGLGDY